MNKCPHCEFEYRVGQTNHTVWCPNATSDDWPVEMLKRIRPKVTG